MRDSLPFTSAAREKSIQWLLKKGITLITELPEITTKEVSTADKRWDCRF